MSEIACMSCGSDAFNTLNEQWACAECGADLELEYADPGPDTDRRLSELVTALRSCDAVISVEIRR